MLSETLQPMGKTQIEILLDTTLVRHQVFYATAGIPDFLQSEVEVPTASHQDAPVFDMRMESSE